MERLVELFASHWGRPTLLDALSTYCEAVRTEIEMLDQIVAGCYSAFDRFDVFVPFSMFYFVGATFAEHRRRSGDPAARNAYLCADLPEFRSALSSAELLLHRTIVDPSPPAVARFTEEVARLLAPFNVAGLCDPSKRNMYPFIS